MQLLAHRPYRTIRALVHAHVGRPAVVLGGGPSLPQELARCPGRDEAVYLSANDHGALLTECDYLVCHDKIRQRVSRFGKPVVSRHMFADYRIMGSIVPSSGVETAWVARAMGCAPIYIAGMDCFAGNGTYYHDPQAESTGFLIESRIHVLRWRDTLRRYPADYRAMGGPLAAELPSWQCVREGVVDRERLLEDVAGLFVTFRAATTVGGRLFAAGCREEFPRQQATRLVERGAAVL